MIPQIRRRRRGSLIVGLMDLFDGHGQQGLGEAGLMAKKQPSDDVSIGKFDILATYT